MKISVENFKANRKVFNRQNQDMTLKPEETFGQFKVTSFILITMNLEFNSMCRKNNPGQRPRICILRSTRDVAILDQLENRVNFTNTVAPGFSIARFSSVPNWLS